MSTRCFIKIKDSYNTVGLYRHSDGYPEGAGADLTEFVQDYKSGALRLDAMQSSGWLIVRGHFEYKAAEEGPIGKDGKKMWPDEPDRTGPRPSKLDKYMGWKVGAYEPAGSIEVPDDVEYVYEIDLVKCTLRCSRPDGKAVREFKTVKFGPKGGSRE